MIDMKLLGLVLSAGLMLGMAIGLLVARHLLGA